MNITILPGSFKPPHKGHLSLLEKLIKQKKNNKIIIIISKKPRLIDNRLQYYQDTSKEELQKALMNHYPKNNKITEMTKGKIVDIIKRNINNNSKNKLKKINAKQSLKVWNIYLNYLKDKYKKQIKNNKFPKVIFKISDSNNIIKDTVSIALKCLRENKPKKIELMKSAKNKNNKRFNFFIKGSLKKYIDVVLFPDIKNIDARDMRKAIFNKNEKEFYKYLPSDMKQNIKHKIWKIVK